jgi:hypothetical protein
MGIILAPEEPGPADVTDSQADSPMDAGKGDGSMIGGGIGPPPEDASKVDVFVTGILVAPDAGADEALAEPLPAGGPLDSAAFPAVLA